MKPDLIKYYKEVVKWQICLYLKFLKKNEFPYQKDYWNERLKSALNNRKIILDEILNKNIKPHQQLQLF